jgi:hypothetical protein
MLWLEHFNNAAGFTSCGGKAASAASEESSASECTALLARDPLQPTHGADTQGTGAVHGVKALALSVEQFSRAVITLQCAAAAAEPGDLTSEDAETALRAIGIARTVGLALYKHWAQKDAVGRQPGGAAADFTAPQPGTGDAWCRTAPVSDVGAAADASTAAMQRALSATATLPHSAPHALHQSGRIAPLCQGLC